MKTYAEANKRKPFNWERFLSRKNITEREWADAGELSSDWVTCACGNQCNIIPRYDNTNWYDGAPKDAILMRLGAQFNGYIHTRNIPKAKRILRAIEKRAGLIIGKMHLDVAKVMAHYDTALYR